MALSNTERSCRWKRRHPERARAGWRKQQAKPRAQAIRRLRLDRAAEYITEFKKQAGCADCPEHDPIVLDFDHRLGTKKLFDIGTNGGGRTLTKIIAEIAKCDVRCANDHRRRTKRDWGKYRGK